MMKNLLVLLLITLFLASCTENKEDKKLPGALQALQLMTMQRAYPNADIPKAGFGQAYEYHKQHFAAQSSRNTEDPWEAKGPLNTAGRTLALAVNPQDPNTVYLGSASGGLWKSPNLGKGQSWEHIETGFPVLGVSAIAITPGDSMNIFLGTGEVYNYQSSGTDGAYRSTRGSYGIGILKSTDAGKSWTKSLDWSYDQQRGVQEVEIAPSNNSIIYAATTHGVYRSDDAGDTWNNVNDMLMATDIAIHPEDPNIVLVGFGNLGSPDRGIFKTINGGASWTKAGSPVPTDFNGKIQLDNVGDIAYASIGNGFSFNDGASWLLSSEDFGSTWTLRNETDYSRWQGWFAHDVAINPTNTDEVTAIGIDIWQSKNKGDLLEQKTQGGVTLGRPSITEPDGGPTYSHSDHHVVMYHPEIPGTILFGNDGGLFLSEDGGETFRSANGGLQTTQFYNGFAVSHQRADFAMGGLQDNSTSIFRGDGAFQRAIGGDGSWSAVNPLDDNIIFGSSQNLNVRFSPNNGINWAFRNVKVDGGPAIFIAPYIISMADPDILYAGGSIVYKSENGGQVWAVTERFTDELIYSMDGSFTNPDVLYVGTAPFTNRPQLFITQDGGTTWEDITQNLPDRFPNDIVVDPNDDATAYVTFSGFGTGHVYKTTDYGSTWEDITRDLPDIPGNAIAVDPLNTDYIYYGNDIAVYFSPDAGLTWENYSEGISDVAIIMDLEISPVDRSLWAATHGRGTYKRPLVSSTVDVVENNHIEKLKIYPNPLDDYAFVEISLSQTESLNLEILDISGKQMMENRMLQMTSGTHEISLDCTSLPSGMYILNIHVRDRIISEKLIVR